MNPFLKDLVGAGTRTTLAVYLVDLLPEEYRELGKAAVVLVVGVWSFYQKYVGRQKLLTAAASSVSMSEAEIIETIANGRAVRVTTPAETVPLIRPSR